MPILNLHARKIYRDLRVVSPGNAYRSANCWYLDAKLDNGKFLVTRVHGDITDVAGIRDAVVRWAEEKGIIIRHIEIRHLVFD
jgi:hypothetical protein